MSDIFLSYASEDLPRVLPLVRTLERHGWSVWWDRTILPARTYDQVIEEALEAARCVIVVWSRASVASGWVRAEAEEGRQRDILVPVILDDGVRIPLGFRPIQAARLVDWDGTGAHQEFDKVVTAVTNLLGSPLREVPAEPVVEVPTEPQPDVFPPRDEESLAPEPREEQKVEVPRVAERQQTLDHREEEITEGDKAWLPRGKKQVLLWATAIALSLLVLTFYFTRVIPLGDQNPPGESPDATGPSRPEDQRPATVSVPEQSVTNSLGMEFVLIPAGEFQMGSTEGDEDERPVHTVRIGRPFYLGKYEVTQAQWEAVMGNNPSRFTGDPNRPVENGSWEEVQEFIRKLNARESGTTYRLPTEAEWEYAARAGSTTAYSFESDSSRLGEYAWYADNSSSTTHPVGQRKPNAWGLYDVHGNVREWVQDWYGKYPAETVTDPQGPSSGSDRVLRGGGWNSVARRCRSAYRRSAKPVDTGGDLGFRLLRTAP
jgi:formylglycine-generating enzyme required for sulfatase activity